MRAPLLLADRLAGPLERLGIDHARFRAILAVKLALDGRRQHGWIQGTRRLTPLAWSLIVHAVMGLWLAALPSLVRSPFGAMILGITVVMVMLAFDLVADYSALLLDPTETAVLAARPVAPRTILAARLAHVGTYLVLYVGALAAGTAITGTLRWGPRFLPAYLFCLLGTVVLVLAAVTLVYLAVMRVASRERLRDATMWAQLVMTALTVGVYYVASVGDLRTGLGIESSPWLPLYPPAWMAALPALAIGRTDRTVVGLAVVGLAVPWLLALVTMRLAPGFRVDTDHASVRARAPRRSRLARALARCVPSATASAFVELVWALAARDRQFKTRTYPGLLAIALFVVAFAVVARSGAWSAGAGDVADTNMHLFLLYYGILVIPTPILMAPYTDQPEAAWIHRALPVERPGTALVAGLVVLVVRFVLPVFAVIAVVVTALWGRRVLVDVAFAFAATTFVPFAFALIAGRRLPFSLPPPGGASGTTAGAVVGGMLLVLLLAGAHALLRLVETPLPQPWPVAAAIPLVLGAAALAARACARTRWRDVRDLARDV